MTEPDRRDSTDNEGKQPPARDVRNEVVAETVSTVVQAGSISGGIHHHLPPQQIPVPQQLPAAPRYFVGRADELARLTADLTVESEAGATVLISALAGAGGIGKTALALHWARQRLDRFPDGQLFVDLQGFSPADKPLDPAVAVRGFLDGLGVDPSLIPPDLQAMAALYRTKVVGKRMLVVLDNAADAGQVVPLLPSSPICTVLVTSRRHLTSLVARHSAQHVRIGVLSETDARLLLTARLGVDRTVAEPTAVEELLACCGGFALALDLVAARAAMNPDVALDDLAAELRDGTSRMTALHDDDPAANLPSVLSWSMRALTDEQTRVFGLLGIAPGPDISLPAAASLADLSLAQTGRVLRGLEGGSLLDRDTVGRYRMHDLVRSYAADTAHHDLAEDVREAALRRVVDFYLHTAHTANQLLAPHHEPIQLDPPTPGCLPHPLPDAPAALAWFDTEHPCLLAAQHAATIHGWHQAVWHQAWTLTTFHHRRGHRHDRVAVWRAALAATEHLPDPTPHTRAHRYLGRAYTLLGRHEEAIRHLHQALALAKQHNDPTAQAHTHYALVWAWSRRGDARRALKHATHALTLFRTLDTAVWEANALTAVGRFTARLGEYSQAREYCQAALSLHHHHHDPYGQASTLHNLGYIDHHTGHHQQAIHHYQQALTLRRDLGDNYEATDTLDGLGHSHAALGQHDQARAVWQEAIELYQRQGIEENAARVQRQLDDLDQRDGAVGRSG